MTDKLPRTKLFPADPEEQKPYINAGWQQHAELVTHLCQFSQNILLVIAPPGGGKTTFLQHCRKLPAAGLRRLVLNAQEDQTAEDLMKEIVYGFDLEWQGIKLAFQQVRACVEEAANKQIIWSLFIDDAHLLSNEQLKMLLHLVRFEAQPQKQLHLVLLGEPSLELRLFSPEFASYLQGKLYTVELETWTLPDVQAFFAKDTLSGHFSAEQIAQVFERSRGIPGYVIRERNQLLQQDKQIGHTMNKPGIKRWGKHPITLGLLAGVVFGATYLLFNSTAEEELSSVSLPLNMAQNETAAAGENAPAAPLPGPEIAYSFEENNTADQPVERQASRDNAPVRSQARAQKQERVVRSVVRAPRQELATQMIEDDEAPIVANAAIVPEESEEVSTSGYLLEAAQESSIKAQEQEALAAVEAVAPAKPLKVKEVATSKPKVKAALKDVETKNRQAKKLNAHEEKALSAHASNGHYTLQLLAASNEENIKHFINKHGIQGKTKYFRTKRAGKDWFIVVYGDYATQQEAQAALNQIPASLKQAKLQPLVRNLSAVQADVNKGQG